MKLAFLSGPRAGEELEVGKDLVVGRESADVEIEDPGVSRQHATFRPSGDGLEVEDMGSTNGTYVNGDKITGTKALEPGDFVTIGGTTLEIRDDWRSAETQAIAMPAPTPVESDDEEYVPTSPISAPAQVDRPVNVRLLLIAAGIVGLILVLGLFFTLGGSDNGFAKEVDAVCAKARTDTSLAGDNIKTLKPAARKLLKTRTKLRQDMAALEPEADQAQAFGTFLQRYATTNDQLERLASLDRKTNRAKLQNAVAKVRSAAEAEAKAAEDMGLKVCGGLPI